MAEGLFFPQTSGATTVANTDYVKDSFKDYVKPATNNTSLTSTISTNPMNDYFNDSGAVKYSTKTLYIKDLVLEEDRSKWVNGGQTYRVEFTENFAGVSGYVVGIPNFSTQVNGKAISLNRTGDGFGVTGNIRKAYFLVKPKSGAGVGVASTSNTTTYSYVIDNGIPTAVTPSLYSDEAGGISTATAGTNNFIDDQFKFLMIDDGTAVQTDDIHDYRIQISSASTLDNLEIIGVVVFLSSSLTSVSIRPSSSFVDKQLVTTTVVSTVALPAQNASLFHLGAKSTFFENQAGTRGVTTYVVPLLQTIATGLSGTTSVAAGTGTGASFPIGTGVNIQTGTSHYYGKVTAQSTDTLTVSPTLPFGIAGATMTKAFFVPDIVNYASTTLDKSVYELAASWDPRRSYGVSNTFEPAFYSAGATNIPAGWTYTPYNPYYDPENRFVILPTTAPGVTASQGRMTTNANLLAGNNGSQFGYGWAGPLTVRGDFQAIEFEFFGTGAAAPGITFLLGASSSIDGIGLVPPGATSLTIGATLPLDFRVLFAKDLGIGWHTLKYNDFFAPASIVPIIKRVNFYKYKGVSIAGQVATLEQLQTPFETPGSSLTTPIGLYKFFGSDKLTYTGAWFKQATGPAASLSIFPGFARTVAGATASTSMSFTYYGKNFVPYFDVPVGGSFSATLDGVATGGLTSGAIFPVATEMLHTLVMTRQAGTFGIQGIGILKDYGELRYKQNFAPVPELTELNGRHLIDKTVSVRKSIQRYIGSSCGLGGVALSALLINSTFSSTTVPEFISSVMLETSGNPVYVGLQPVGYTSTLGAPNLGLLSGLTTGIGINLWIARIPYDITKTVRGDQNIVGITGQVAAFNTFLRVGTTTGFIFSHQLQLPITAINSLDVAPPGRWAYRLYGTGGVSCVISNCRLFAMEMF